MNWQQIADCAANGVEIGSHTFSHDVLSTITDESILYKEIVYSVREMEEQLKRPVNILALPNGEGNSMLAKPLAEAGIKYVLNVEDKLNDLRQLNASPQNLNRINLVEEPLPAMILRTEMFHAKMKKYV